MVENRLLVFALILVSVLACNRRQEESQESPRASASSTSSVAYRGPTGSVSGVVRITGDEPPVLPTAAEIPVGKCFKAHEKHRLLFRKGPDGSLADALVAVTEYKGELPKPTEPVVVQMEDCSIERRTIAVSMGQSIHMKNRGPTAAMPQLVGLPTPAVMVAVPGGDPIILTPHAPGRFQLIDRSHPYASAEVFVVNYPTVSVSDEQGRFEIAGIPEGEAKLNVMLPAAGLTLSKPITITPGKPLDLTLELRFDSKLYQAARSLGEQQENAASASSAVPATSPSASAP